MLPQRVEDRVLEVLVKKTETIKKELGSLSKVIDDDIERRLGQGIRHRDAEQLAREIEQADLDAETKRVTEEELEAARERQEDLKAQIERCQSLLEASRAWTGFEAAPFRDALSCSLELLGAEPLAETTDDDGRRSGPSRRSTAARRPTRAGPPPSTPSARPGSRTRSSPTGAARRRSGRSSSRTRACSPRTPSTCTSSSASPSACWPASARRASSTTTCRAPAWRRPRLDPARDPARPPLALRPGAERLHEELVPLAARWVEPSQRKGPLAAYAREAEAKTLDLLERSLGDPGRRAPGEAIQRKLLAAAPRDIEELLPQLEPRAEELAALAIDKLQESAASARRRTCAKPSSGSAMRVREELAKHEGEFQQLTLDFGDEEKRQLESDMRSWRTRLEQFDRDLEREPQRIREFYEVRAKRVEPVGLVYLWPETN